MTRRVGPTVVVVVLLLSGCGGGARSEVRTNSGGVLDCPSSTVLYAAVDSDLSGPGASSPMEAAAEWIGGEFLPDGVPSIESQAGDSATVVILDSDENRVGRVLTVDHDSGWHVQGTEACG